MEEEDSQDIRKEDEEKEDEEEDEDEDEDEEEEEDNDRRQSLRGRGKSEPFLSRSLIQGLNRTLSDLGSRAKGQLNSWRAHTHGERKRGHGWEKVQLA